MRFLGQRRWMSFALGIGVALSGCSTQANDTEAQNDAVSAAGGRFEPRAEERGFSIVNAAWLARAAHVVYRHRDRQVELRGALEDAVKKLGGPSVKIDSYRFFDATTDTQAAYLATDRVAILAFRGTESKADWRRDLQFKKKEIGPAKMHRGFYDGARGVWDGTDLKFSDAERNDPSVDKSGLGEFLAARAKEYGAVPLYITGHSLGAGLANIVVYKALEDKIPVYAYYSFGSPRSGDDGFAEDFAARATASGTKVFRVVNYGDPITVVPPRWLNFKHIAAPGQDEDEKNERFVFLSKTPGVHFVGTAKGEHDFFDRVTAYWASIRAGHTIHHPIVNYSCQLDRLLDPNAPCLELVQRDANRTCVEMGRALADAAARPTRENGCGEDRQENVKAFTTTAQCDRVASIRDEEGLRKSCFPAIKELTCAQLRDPELTLPESCNDPFVYEADPEPSGDSALP